MPSRREFLKQAGSGLAALTMAMAFPQPAWSAETYDILYFDWVPDLDDALDHLGQLEEGILSEEESRRLEVVARDGGGFGVITRYEKAPRQAAVLATVHSTLLQKASGSDEILARAIPAKGYSRVYNVSYGLGPNFKVLKRNWDTVARTLGPGVTRSLIIERTASGNYALVYKRYGDINSTATVARRHARLLKNKGIGASFIQERNNQTVWNGSSNPSIRPDAPSTLVQAEPSPEPTPRTEVQQPSQQASPGQSAQASSQKTSTALRSDAKPRRGSGQWELKPGKSSLQPKIDAYIKSLRAKGRVPSNEATSWLVYDLSRDKTVAAINADTPRQCASMVKPLVMLAFFSEVQRGRFIYGSKSRSYLEAMIQKSSNSSTNWVMDQIGGPSRVQAILQERFPGLLPQASVVEKIAAGGKTYKNKASAADYGRLLRALWNDRLPYSAEMKRIMNLPGRDRICSSTTNVPAGTQVYNKTGSTARLCGDMGILVPPATSGKKRPYIMVGIFEKQVRTSSYSAWIRDRSSIVRAVSDMAYLHMKSIRDVG